jgi:hypothetical protein
MSAHQDARAGAEKAYVDGDKKLDQGSAARSHLHSVSWLAAASPHPGGNARAESKQNGRGSEQPRHHVQKRKLRGAQQDNRSEHAPANAGQDQGKDLAASLAPEFFAIGADAGHAARPKRHGVGGIRVHRRYPGE